MRYIVLFCLLLADSFSYAQLKQDAKLVRRPNLLFINADDWGMHAGVFGDQMARTPFFDSLALEGALFDKAFITSPSCTPSRASMLTGKYPHQLGPGANLWSYLPSRFPVFPDQLAAIGYATGYAEKGWGPGGGWLPGWPSHDSGYKENPAGRQFKSLDSFLDSLEEEQPFCFWWGIKEPHRPYQKGIGIKNGYAINQLIVPPFLPATESVKTDLLDYYYYVEMMDKKFRHAFGELSQRGLLENTCIIITSDNGMPFNRAKTNLYDQGTNVPLLLYWKNNIAPARYRNELVSLIDIYATVRKLAGLPPDKSSPSRELFSLLTGERRFDTQVYFEREFHAQPGPANQLPEPEGYLSYPMRGIRTKDYLFIKNYRPDRFPAGSYNLEAAAKEYAQYPQLLKISFDQRPEAELYLVQEDSYQLNNKAGENKLRSTEKKLIRLLKNWQKQTEDPRLLYDDNRWDFYPLYRNRSETSLKE